MSAARAAYGLTLAAAAVVGVATGLAAARGLRDFLDRLAEIGDYPLEQDDCWCWTCNPELQGRRMFLCNECGNKRCPRAADHRHACTASNEPDQEGSRYSRGTVPAGIRLPQGARVQWFAGGHSPADAAPLVEAWRTRDPVRLQCSICLTTVDAYAGDPIETLHGWSFDGQGWSCPRHMHSRKADGTP